VPLHEEHASGARLLAYVTGMLNQHLGLQDEYLAAENRILRAHLPTRLQLTDAQRSTLAEIGKRLGRQAFQQVARVAKPDTILMPFENGLAADASRFWESRKSMSPAESTALYKLGPFASHSKVSLFHTPGPIS
jgi:hypothetical protein